MRSLIVLRNDVPFFWYGWIANVQQNKNKVKKGQLPADMMETGHYHAALTTGDVWICYPWEAQYVI